MCTSNVTFYPQVYTNTDSPPQGKHRNWASWSSACNKKRWHCGKNSFSIDYKNHLERFSDICPEKLKSQCFLFVTAILIVSFLLYNLGKSVLKIKIFLFYRKLLLHPEDFIAWVAFLLSQSIFLVQTKSLSEKKKYFDLLSLLWCLMGIVSMGLSYLCTDFSRDRLYVLGWSISLLNQSSVSAKIGYSQGCLYLVTHNAFPRAG